MNDKLKAEFISGISKDEPLFKRLSNSWYVEVVREGETLNVLLETLTPKEQLDWWDSVASDKKDDYELIQALALVYALDKLKAHQEFLTVEGYVRV